MRSLGVVLLGSALVAGSAHAQGLAAAAEKEKERRAKQQQDAGQSGKSYDDATLAASGGTLANDPSIPPAVSSSSGKGAASRGGPTLGTATSRPVTSGTTTTSAPSARGNGEEYWRSRAQQLRAAFATAEAQVKRLEREAGLAPSTPGPQAVPCQQGVEPKSTEGAIALRDRSRRTVSCESTLVQDAARAAQSQLDAARRTLEQARSALAGLDDEARRAGALPGWIR